MTHAPAFTTSHEADAVEDHLAHHLQVAQSTLADLQEAEAKASPVSLLRIETADGDANRLKARRSGPTLHMCYSPWLYPDFEPSFPRTPLPHSKMYHFRTQERRYRPEVSVTEEEDEKLDADKETTGDENLIHFARCAQLPFDAAKVETLPSSALRPLTLKPGAPSVLNASRPRDACAAAVRPDAGERAAAEKRWSWRLSGWAM